MRNPWLRAAVVVAAAIAFLASSRLADLDISHFPHRDFWDRLLLRFAGRSPRDVHLLLYSATHIALFGVAIPLLLAWRMRIPLRETRSPWRLAAGLAVVLAVSAVALHRSELTWSFIQHHEYQLFLKYAFYYFSLGLAVVVLGFYLVPAALAGLAKSPWRKQLLSSLGCVLVLHFVQKYEVLPLGRTPPGELVWYGVALFAARLLAATPAVALPGMIALLFALCYPAKGEYLSTAWRPMLATFLLCFWSLCLYLSTRTKKRFPPQPASTPKAS